MRRRSLAMILALAILAFAAAGCGGGGDNDKDKGEAANCGETPAAMSGTPQLPTAFPAVSGVTYTGQTKEGPTTKVSGYKDGDLDQSFDAYNEALDGKNGWSVTSKEKEEDDAEVNFSGHGTTGQVALKACDEDRTNVEITVRPA